MLNDTDENPEGLTHEQYIEELQEMGIDTEGVQDFEGLLEAGHGQLTIDATNELADRFLDFGTIIAGGGQAMVELHQKLEPKHARSPKRYAQHKKAVANRKKRKRGGKK